MMTKIRLVNTSIISHSYHFVGAGVGVCAVRTFKIYFLSNFQVHI